MSTGLGEFWDNWEKETEDLKKQVADSVKQGQERAKQYELELEAQEMTRKQKLQERYNFTLTDEEVIALERLEGLAVNKYRNDDYSWQNSFYKVWVSVQHEVDMYEEGEDSPLNKNSCRGAKRWLAEYEHLCERGRNEY